MTEWWTYRPSDFLLFSPRVYERLIESHNAGLWPWQLVAVALGVAVLFLSARGGRAALALVGAGVAVSGWSFLWSRYAGINFAAGSFAPAFWLAGAGFLAAALLRDPLSTAGQAARWTALALVALAVAYPLAGPLFGRGWSAMEVVGLMTDPTALMALGVAALVRRPILAAALALVPLAWALYAAMTLWTLGSALAWAMIAGLLLFVLAVILRVIARGR